MSLVPTIATVKMDGGKLNPHSVVAFNRDTQRVLKSLASVHLGPLSVPSFSTLNLNGLTASRLLALNAFKDVTSVETLSSWVSGTTNRITVSDNPNGTITLSGPQDIHTGASPTFAGMTLTGFSGVLKTTAGVVGDSATLDDVADGTTYGRVLANQLSSGIYINATDSVKGIASFDSGSFTVTEGHVTMAAGGGLMHNDLGGLQGGTADEYYHLTQTEHGYVSGPNAQSVLTTASPEFVNLSLTDRLECNRAFIYTTSANDPFSVIGDSTPSGMRFYTYRNNPSGGFMESLFARGSFDSPESPNVNDRVLSISGRGWNSTAGVFNTAAQIQVFIDGTPDNDMPGRLIFLTTPVGGTGATERMRINSAGSILIGKTAGTELLEVAGKIRSDSAFNLNGTDGVSNSAVGVPTALTVAGGVVTEITKNDWLDQDVRVAAAPFFPQIKIAGTGLVGHWKMNDDADNTDVLDSSGNDLTLTAQQNTEDISVSGKIDKALFFDGTSDYCRLAVSDFRSTDTRGTMMCWVKLSSLGASVYPISSADEGSTTRYIAMRVTADNRLALLQNNAGTMNGLEVQSISLLAGVWYHLCITSDGTRYRAYINGIEYPLVVTSGVNNGDWFADTDNRDNLVIGALVRTSVGSHVAGDIDDVRIYDRDLTNEEIQAVYNNGDGREDVPHGVEVGGEQGGTFTFVDNDGNTITVVGGIITTKTAP